MSSFATWKTRIGTSGSDATKALFQDGSWEVPAGGGSFNAHGNVRIARTNDTTLTMSRYKGIHIPLKIGGVWTASEVPSAGVTLANTGLTAATKYNIYAYDDTGTMTLEGVTTAHSTDADTGVEIKTGDATRTFVGSVYMGAGTPGVFVDTAGARYVLNWFNRRRLPIAGTFSADRGSNVDTFAELNSEIRCNFLTWPDEAVSVDISGTSLNDGAGQATGTGISFDGNAAVASTSYTHSANQRGPIAVSANEVLTEGFHYVTLFGAVSGGNGSWLAATAVSTGSAKVRISGSIIG